MKRFFFTLAILLTVVVGINAFAARPNPPAITGSVPIVRFTTPPGSTNSVPVPPRIHVLDEHGRNVADVEATVDGTSAVFNINLKKAGSYAVWAYYPDQVTSTPQVVDVPKKQTATVNLGWPQ